MNSNIAQIILITVILVATVGVFFVASACGGAGMQALLGMNMEGCLSALTHPILAFVMIFAAVAVVMGALVLAPLRAFSGVILDNRSHARAKDAWYKSLNYERKNSEPLLFQQLITRRFFQKREDSDDPH